jgi:hypothetical protein
MMPDDDARLARLEDKFRELEVMYRDILLTLKEASEGRWAKADAILERSKSAPSTEAGAAGRGASPEARPPLPAIEEGADPPPLQGLMLTDADYWRRQVERSEDAANNVFRALSKRVEEVTVALETIVHDPKVTIEDARKIGRTALHEL